MICEGFERIHRTNLVGMGVLPLEFQQGTSRRTLAIDGTETFTLEGLKGAPEPGSVLTLIVKRRDGSEMRTQVKCRIDTTEERLVFEAGGLLPRIGNELRHLV